MDTKGPQPVIVTGMHRSGTSFLASLMSALSIDVGTRLLPPDSNNPLGYFEDIEFLDLQRRMLAGSCASGDGGHPDWGWTETQLPDARTFSRYLPEARSLLSARSGGSHCWGWKDPRTTLLLDFWEGLLKDARYVLVYRFPWDVADSMQRLGAEVFLRNPDYAYRIWTYYNRHIRDFYRKHPDRCLLVSINALRGAQGRFTDLLGRKLGLEICNLKWEEVYRDELFNAIEGSDPLIDLVAAVWPDCTRLLSELDELADISAVQIWRAMPVKSRLLRPDAGTVAGHAVDLSVVIPCYEQGPLLIEAIASVERDARPDWELIIVNDGSRQARTLAILDLLKHCGYFVVDQSNEGLSAARNAGISLARGRYILPLDDDNRIRPGFIEEATRLLDSFPEVGVVYGDRYDFGLRTGVQKIPDFELGSMLSGNYIDACAVIRKQLWADCNGYDPAMSPIEDWELWIHAARKGWRFVHIPRVTFEYRVRPNSLISRVDSAELLDDFRKRIRIKHSELYWSTAVKEIENLRQQLAEQFEHQKRVEVDRRLEKTELESVKAQIAETDHELRVVKLEVAQKEQELVILQSEIAFEKSQISKVRQELQTISSEADLKGQRVEELTAVLAERDAQLARIVNSLGWRLLSLYGRIKYPYLLPLYRLFGARTSETGTPAAQRDESEQGVPDTQEAKSQIR